MNGPNNIYMDHAATTPVRPEVIEAMLPYLEQEFGNPSSLHSAGRRARDAVERSRERVAAALGVRPLEIVFTSGGTEADNLAVFGGASLMRKRGRGHLVTSPIEHHAVAYAFGRLRDEGAEVTVVPVDGAGRIDPGAVEEAVRPESGLISIMLANNEIGTVQPIAEIGRALEGRGVIFHTDAVQAVGKVPLDIPQLGVDLLSVSSHKIRGPKGMGALYVKRGLNLPPQAVGGPHEFGRRAGTENVPGIVGFSAALDLAVREQEETARRMAQLRDRLEEGIFLRIRGAATNGHRAERLPGILNIRFESVPAEGLVVRLDERGVAISSGSACTAETIAPSHVLLALGLDPGAAASAVRFSVATSNTEAEVDAVLDLLVEIVTDLRPTATSAS